MYLISSKIEGLESTLPIDFFEGCYDLALGCTEDTDLLNLLYKTRFAKFANPRDRVFALLGFLDAAEVSLIDADYNEPITKVFQRVCSAYLQLYGDMGFLLHCDLTIQEQNPGHPSWTPNWSAWRPNDIFGVQYAAARIQIRHDVLSGSRCTVDGVLCGIVDKVSNEAPLKGEMRETLRCWEELVAKDDLERTEQLIQALWCGQNKEAWPDYEFPSLKQHRKAYYSRDKEPITDGSVRGRSIFTYGDGGMGIGSSGAKTGMCEIPLRTTFVYSLFFQLSIIILFSIHSAKLTVMLCSADWGGLTSLT
jgi:hypothetical protein